MDAAQGIARRAFLKRAVVGVGAVGALAAYPALLDAVAGDGHGADEGMASVSLSEPMLMFVTDAAKGEAVVLTGDSEFVVQDPALVSRLVRARGAQSV